MPVIVTPESQAIQLQKVSPLKMAPTNAFAQMMHAFLPMTEMPTEDGAANTSRQLADEVTVSDDLVVEEDLDEKDETALPLNVAIEFPQKALGVEKATLEAGAAVSVLKSNPLGTFPPAFIAQGWQITTSHQQVARLASPKLMDDVISRGLIEKSTGTAAAILPLKLDASVPTINTLSPSSGGFLTDDARLSSQALPVHGVGGAPQVASHIPMMSGVVPDAARQLWTSQTQNISETVNFEADLPREQRNDITPRTEPRVGQIDVPVPLVSGSNVGAELPLAQVSNISKDELDFAVLGAADRVASTPTAPVDVKAAPPAQVATVVAQQLAVAVHRNPNGVTELVLNPEELGRVRLSMATHDGALTLTITTERPETQDLMRRHIETLTQELRQMGFRDVGFSFQGQGQQGQNQGPQSSGLLANFVEGEALSPLASVTQTSGLDLRL